MIVIHLFSPPTLIPALRAPADKAGIKVEGDNKWFTITQNPSKNANDDWPSALK